MMSECEKCGDSDILTKHIKEGELINSSSPIKIEDDFISSSEFAMYYQLKAKKEHLSKHCRNCQYAWREDILNNQ